MSEKLDLYSSEQLQLLKSSANALLLALNLSKDPMASELLKGELGFIITKIISEDSLLPFERIPHFEKMTRDYLPEIEEEYFNFYSLALYGEL
jgi:hypothetical protein